MMTTLRTELEFTVLPLLADMGDDTIEEETDEEEEDKLSDDDETEDKDDEKLSDDDETI